MTDVLLVYDFVCKCWAFVPLRVGKTASGTGNVFPLLIAGSSGHRKQKNSTSSQDWNLFSGCHWCLILHFLVFQVPGLFQIVAYPVSSTIPLMWWSGWAVQPRYPAGQRATLSPPFSGSEMANHLIQTRWMCSHSLSFYQKEVCSSSASSPAERVSPMKQCMPALLGTAPGLRPAETPLFT